MIHFVYWGIYWGILWKYVLFQEWFEEWSCCGCGLTASCSFASCKNSPCQTFDIGFAIVSMPKMSDLGIVWTLVKSSSDGWWETLMGDCPPSIQLYSVYILSGKFSLLDHLLKTFAAIIPPSHFNKRNLIYSPISWEMWWIHAFLVLKCLGLVCCCYHSALSTLAGYAGTWFHRLQ